MGFFICGNVICGFPSPGEEYREESLDFNDYLVKHKLSTFCLRSYGDSMAPTIRENDILVVDRSLCVRNGDIVVAEYNGDFTVKYFYKKNSSCFLVPENKAYKEIEVNQNTRLFGVVTSIVRKFRK